MTYQLIEETEATRGINTFQWRIRTTKKSILKAHEIESASASINVPLPEICFGNNSLSLVHTPTNWTYTFDPLEALRQVDDTGERPGKIKVAHAERWAQSRINSEHSEALTVVKNFDWTYSTTYAGTSSSQTCQTAPPEHPGIPLDKLASQAEEILFYDEIPLFEDELHDCGNADLTVRIRVMPSGFFVLSRFFLRVDKVLFRIFDVRIYHEFGSDHVVRESKGKEASYDTLKKMLPAEKPHDLSLLSDINWVAQRLGMLDNIDATSHASEWPGATCKLEILKLSAL